MNWHLMSKKATQAEQKNKIKHEQQKRNFRSFQLFELNNWKSNKGSNR